MRFKFYYYFRLLLYHFKSEEIKKKIIIFQADLKSKYPKDDDMLFKLVYQGTLGAQGLPLGVQVVGKPWNEELVLHVMKLLESNRKMSFPWFFYVDHCYCNFLCWITIYPKSSSRYETSRVKQKNVLFVIF